MKKLIIPLIHAEGPSVVPSLHKIHRQWQLHKGQRCVDERAARDRSQSIVQVHRSELDAVAESFEGNYCNRTWDRHHLQARPQKAALAYVSHCLGNIHGAKRLVFAVRASLDSGFSVAFRESVVTDSCVSSKVGVSVLVDQCTGITAGRVRQRAMPLIVILNVASPGSAHRGCL